MTHALHSRRRQLLGAEGPKGREVSVAAAGDLLVKVGHLVQHQVDKVHRGWLAHQAVLAAEISKDGIRLR